MSEFKSGLTGKSVAFGIVYSVIIVVIVTMLGGFTRLNPDSSAITPWDIGGPDWTVRTHTMPWTYFVMLIVPLMLPSLLPKFKFNRSELTVIYTMIMASITAGNPWCLATYGPAVWLPSAVPQGEPWLGYFLDAVPGIWVPGKDIGLMTGFLYGGEAVPWGIWLTPFVYWALWTIFYGYIFIFLSALMRKAYIKTLVLPFPLAQGAEFLVRSTATETSNPLYGIFRSKWLWIGFGIGTLIHIMSVPHFFIPGVPFLRPRADLTSLIQGVLPFSTLILAFDAFYIGASYLLTKEILITTIVFTHIFGIVYPSMFVSSFGGPGGMVAAAWLEWGYTVMHWWGAPDLNYSLQSLVVGVAFGMTGWLLWRARDSLKEMFKGIWTKPKPEEDLSYRSLWVGLIVSFILLTAMLAIANIPVWWTIIVLVILAIWQIGLTVWRGDSGMAAGFAMLGTMGGRYVIAVTTAITLGILGGRPALAVGMPMALLLFFIYDQGQGTWTMPYFSMETFKLGELTKTRDRDVLLSQIATYAISVTIVIPIVLFCGYTWGILNKWNWTDLEGSSGAWTVQFAAQNAKEGLWHTGPNAPGMPFDVSVFLIGIVLCIGLYILRSRIPALPLHPAGILLGLLFYGQLWMPALIALIAKYATIKVGGAKLYEEKGIPVAVGLITSMGFIMMLEIIGRLLTGI